MNLYSVLMGVPPTVDRKLAESLSAFGRCDQCSYVWAATSKAAAYRLLSEQGYAAGLSRYAFDQYGSGWNEESTTGLLALANPGTIYWRPLDPADRDLIHPLAPRPGSTKGTSS